MENITQQDITEAVQCLRRGEIIAYPTEAVYGLGCDPFNLEAVFKLLQIKQRSIDKGFILVASEWEQLEPYVELIAPTQLARVLATWPGPVTWIFPAKPEIPHWIRGQHSTIAVRVSNHPVIQALCDQYDQPIVSTSANIEGAPPMRDFRSLHIAFGQSVSKIIAGKVGGRNKPTEIRDAISGEIVRAG